MQYWLGRRRRDIADRVNILRGLAEVPSEEAAIRNDAPRERWARLIMALRRNAIIQATVIEEKSPAVAPKSRTEPGHGDEPGAANDKRAQRGSVRPCIQTRGDDVR
jgi:hypothetical protein